MPIPEGVHLVQRPDILWADVEGETVLYDPVSGRAHLLSPSGSLLWPAFSSPVSVEELAEDVSASFEILLAEAVEQVRAFCDQLLEVGALQPADATGSGT